jgi:hypothetical protein
MSDELKPINPGTDYLISMELNVLDNPEMLEGIQYLHEDTEVVLEWRNATIIARAGTISGWLGLGSA